MKNNSLRKTLVAAIVGGFGLACHVVPASAGPFSATRGVIAIVDGELFVGNAEGHLDGSGTIAIHSQLNPALICLGQFTSSAEQGGSGSLLCNDGASADFRFQRQSVFRGHGAGSSSRGAMTFAYGFTALEAMPYLKLPDGKKFSPAGTELKLVDL
jgi:hypothetical protein